MEYITYHNPDCLVKLILEDSPLIININTMFFMNENKLKNIKFVLTAYLH